MYLLKDERHKRIFLGDVKMSLCECGCGGEAKHGNRYINGHQNRGRKLSKEAIQKGKETQRINKEIREGKQPAPVLPFCECGCGQRVTKPGNRFIYGHNTKGKNNGFYGHKHTEEVKEYLRDINLGKVLDDSLKNDISNGLNDFYQTEEGDKLKKQKSERWKDEKNNPMKDPKIARISGERNSEVKKKKFANGEIEIWNKGETKYTDIRIRKYGEKLKGKKRSKETRQKNREALVKRLKNGDLNRKPTNIELFFQEICQKYNLPFRYVGDGQLWIGKEKLVNPDFIECNGRKIVIEILGDYWHSALFNKRVHFDDLKNREKHYRRYKWKVIFIWESDIMRPEGEEFVLSLLRKEGVI